MFLNYRKDKEYRAVCRAFPVSSFDNSILPKIRCYILVLNLPNLKKISQYHDKATTLHQDPFAHQLQHHQRPNIALPIQWIQMYCHDKSTLNDSIPFPHDQ